MAPPTLRSVHRAFRILKSFEGPGEWLSCAELARRSGLKEGAAQRMVQTLVQVGVIACNPEGQCRLNPYFTPYGEPKNAGAVILNFSKSMSSP